jgi:hypothetical protein
MISNYTTRHLIELRFGNKQHIITLLVDYPIPSIISDKMAGLPRWIPEEEIPNVVQ